MPPGGGEQTSTRIPPDFLSFVPPCFFSILFCVQLRRWLNPLHGSWARDDMRAYVKSVVGHRSWTGTLAVSIAGSPSAVGYRTCPTFLFWVIFQLHLRNSPPRVALARCLLHVCTTAQQTATAAFLLYRSIYMTMGWGSRSAGGLWVRTCGCADSVARLAALVRARAHQSFG